MSQKSYCAQQSLKTSSFRYWAKQLRAEDAPSSKFIPITVTKEVVSVRLTASAIQLDVSVDVLEQVLPALCRSLREVRWCSDPGLMFRFICMQIPLICVNRLMGSRLWSRPKCRSHPIPTHCLYFVTVTNNAKLSHPNGWKVSHMTHTDAFHNEEQQRFHWHRASDEPLTLDGLTLNSLLDGIDIWRQKPHKSLSFSSVT